MHNRDFEPRLRDVLRMTADQALVRPGAAGEVLRRARPARMAVPFGVVAVAVGVALGAGTIASRPDGQTPAGFGKRNNRSGPGSEETSEPSPTQTPTPQLSPSPEPENPPWELIDSGTISGEPWKLMYFPTNNQRDFCPIFGLGYNNWYGAGGYSCPARIDHLIVMQAAFEDFPDVAPVFGVVTREVDAVEITLEGSNEAETLQAHIYPGPEEVELDYFLAFVPSFLERGYVTAKNADGEVLLTRGLCMAEYIQTYGIDPMPLCQHGR